MSIFRRFSSPVKWESNLSLNDYLFLFLNDNDYFSRWDSSQLLMREIIKNRIKKKGDYLLEGRFINAIKESIKFLEINDSFFLSTLLTIPGFSELESLFEIVDPINIYKQSLNFKVLIGKEILQDLKKLTKSISININKEWPLGKGERKLLGTIWAYLALAGDETTKKDCVKAIGSSSMTIARGALEALKPLDSISKDRKIN